MKTKPSKTALILDYLYQNTRDLPDKGGYKPGSPVTLKKIADDLRISTAGIDVLLAPYVSKSYVIKALQIVDGKKCGIYKIGTAYIPGVVARMEHKPPVEHIEPAQARSSEEQSSAHHHAQHKVAQNVCSAGSAISSETPLAEARAPIEYTAETAGHVQELANALDRITELKRELETERAKRRPESAVMIAQLQALMTNGTSLHIHGENIYLKDANNKEYGIEPHEFDQAIAALEFLGRKAA